MTETGTRDRYGQTFSVRVVTREGWQQGPPHELFARLRGECPVHWSDGFDEFPHESYCCSRSCAASVRCTGQTALTSIPTRPATGR